MRVCELAKVSGLTLHGLRHTCATLLRVRAGRDTLAGERSADVIERGTVATP